ncbi:MAG: TPM domain-containing protein [Nanoarchaeota archaeon]
MKGVLLVLMFLALPFAQAAYSISGYVNDYAGIIDAASKAEIEGIAQQLQQNGSAEYAVVTIPSLEGRDIEGYAFELAEGHLGNANNNGLLLLVSLQDRKYRFEVGRGLEARLNDAKVGRIGRYFLVPNFKSGNYSKGILEATKAVQEELTCTECATGVPPPIPRTVVIVLSILFVILFIVLPITVSVLKKKGIIKDVKSQRYFDAASGAVILFGSGPKWGGGHSGGGFGGFGGGSFGGGGAGGGW